MALLLQNAEKIVVSDLSPLELGDTTLLFIIVAGIILVGFVIFFLITFTRRSAAMSDEISKQSHAKFAAITPTSTSVIPTQPQTREVMEKPQPSSRLDRVQDASGYLALRKDMIEAKLQFERYVRENTNRDEKLRETRAEVEKLGTEVLMLRDRLNASGQELQRIKTITAEQSFKLQNQRQDIERQRTQIEKIWEGPEVQKLTAEVTGLREGLRTNEQELQKLRTTSDEQGANVKRVSDLVTQTRGILSTTRPQVILPTVETVAPSFQQAQTTPNLTPKTCVSCGSPLDLQDRFCVHCGQRII